MRPLNDYGNHLTNDGVPMCRMCRINCERLLQPAQRKLFYKRNPCPFCKRILRIMREIQMLTPIAPIYQTRDNKRKNEPLIEWKKKREKELIEESERKNLDIYA